MSPFWEEDPDDSSNIYLNYNGDLSLASKYSNGIPSDAAQDGFFFKGLDGRPYLIYRGEVPAAPFSFEIPSASAVNAGIWKFDDTNGWERVLGVQGTMGSCEEGVSALACSASPRDMFVSGDGVVYFIEENFIKKIDENGDIAFVTGRSSKVTSSTSQYVYRPSLLLGPGEFNGDFIADMPMEGQSVVLDADGELSIGSSSPYVTYSVSSDYMCNDEGKVCEKIPGGSSCSQINSSDGLVDVIAFPEAGDYLYVDDDQQILDTSRGAYINDWKCVGDDIFEYQSGQLLVPYFHRGSGGLMRLKLQ